MASEKRAAINVFCSYSEEDRRFQEKLEKHLTSLEREGSAFVWAKHKVRLGQARQHEIDAQLMQARLILLLISANFISSDDCYAGDLMKALQRRHDANVVVIPILLKPCTWDNLAFSELLVMPRNLVPVSQCRDQDEAFTRIVEEIKQVVKDLRLYGDTYMEPLQPPPGRRDPPQRSRITQATNGIHSQKETRSRKQTNILNEEATLPATTKKIVKTMPRSRTSSGGNTRGRFFTFFLENLSGKAFTKRCTRWKGNSGLLLFLFVLIDLFLLPYTVYLRTHAQNITGVIGGVSLVLFLIGVFNEENAIGLPVAVVYFPIWIAMGEWYLNNYLGYGFSQLSILMLVLIITIGRLLLFLWRSPLGQR